MSIRWTAEHRRIAVLAAIVLVPTIVTAIGLMPELVIPVPSNNDDATHFLLIQRMSEALARGENPIDFWVPEVELGFPWLVYYQPLPALLIVALHRLLFGLVDLLTVFNAVRYVLLVGFPVTVFWSLRRMGVSAFGAAVAAAAAPLFSGAFRYGFDYDSYVWRGFGLYTQLAAMHLSFVVLAVVWRTLRSRDRTSLVWGSLAITALILTHLIYSYMMAITLLIVVVAAAESRRDVLRRLARYVVIGVPAAAATAWLWYPFLSQTPYAGVSPYLQPEKYDSFGAPAILGWLVSGDLMDHGRLPVITALLAVGVVGAALTRTVLARSALALFAVWLVLYFGRPTLGPLTALLPMHDSLLMHRFIGSVELFAIVLIGVGAAWCAELAKVSASPRRLAAASAVAVALLVPAVLERAEFYSLNTTWMRQTNDAIAGDADARTIVAAIRDQPAGRVFAGLRSSGFGARGMDFAIPFNSVRFSDLLIFDMLPVVASPYSSASLNADLFWDFDVARPDDYQLFDVRYVVAPSDAAMPSFLRPIVRTPRYVLYVAPTTGYATYAEIDDRRQVVKQTGLFAVNRPWFNGPDNALRFHRFDYPAPADRALAGGIPACSSPRYSYERAQPDRLDLIVACPERSALVLKVTYHPNWHVTVDGRETPTFMASPSLIGIELEPGGHFVTADYRSTPVKAPLLALGLLIVVAELAYAWRTALRRAAVAARDWARSGGPGRVVRRLPQLQQ